MKHLFLLLFSFFLAGFATPSPCHSVNQLPDPTCTPGAVRTTDVKDICTTKTDTIRPPVSYTNPLKLKSIKDYGYSDTDPTHYEFDHLISLQLGGAPKDPKNLWAEPGNSPNEKDKVEGYLHRAICAGTMTPQQAQHGISTNWRQYLPVITK